MVTNGSVFWNETRWNQPTNLKEALNRIFPDRLDPYVTDYKINVFEIAWLSEKRTRSEFRSDFPDLLPDSLWKRGRIPNYISGEINGN